MARKSSRSVDASAITNELDSLLLEPLAMPALHPMSPFSLPDLEDRREFHPEAADRPPSSFHHYTEYDVYERAPQKRVVKRASFSRPYARTAQDRAGLPQEIGFRAPDRVAICVRRKRRKEVLHALRKTGRGGSRRRRYNAYSKVRC